jgi:hypothetical protein
MVLIFQAHSMWISFCELLVLHPAFDSPTLPLARSLSLLSTITPAPVSPRGFTGLPVPAPSKTRTLDEGYGFSQVGVRVLYGFVRVCGYEPHGYITGSMYYSTLRE